MASVRIGTAFGIPIKVGASFLLVLPLVAYLIGSRVTATVSALNAATGVGLDAAALSGGPLPWLLGGAAALGLFVGVILHEFGHSLVARRYGLEIESITLWFLGGMARFVRFPDDWRQELAIAVAGPAVSVALGGLCYGAFLAVPPGLPAAQFVLGYLALVNVALAAFNLLPGFPMDGGRVLRALLARNRPRERATRIAATVGKGFAALLGVAGLLAGNLFWVALAFFLYLAAGGEARQAAMEAAFEGLTVGDVMTPAVELDTVTPGDSVDHLVGRMLRDRHTGYPVVGNDGLVGIVTLEDVESVDEADHEAVTVGDVMSTSLVTIGPDQPAGEAMTAMQREDVGRLPVTDDSGDLGGLLSRTDLVTVFQVATEHSDAEPGRRPTAG